MKNFTFLFLVVFFWQSSVVSQTTIPAGNVFGTWGVSGSPYLVQGNILVPNDSSLIIEPGVTIEFQGHYKLFCAGRILANGASGDSILFTVPSGNEATGWFGIRFDGTTTNNDTSFFAYCKVQYGNANGTANDGYGGAFYFNNFSKCIIDHCYIANNSAHSGGGAICCSSSSPVIQNSTFKNHYSYNGGQGIQFDNSASKISNCSLTNNSSIYFYNSSLVITGNYIADNMGEGGVTGFSSSSNSSIIRNNTIVNNTNDNGAGGAGILLFNSSAEISSNYIANNSTSHGGGGITCFNSTASGTAEIYNNVIVNNYSGNNTLGATVGGGGINCYQFSPVMYNNTICNNYSDYSGGGIYCSSGANPSISNTILYGNTAINGIGDNIFLYDNNSDPSFIYCDIEGGAGAVNANGNPYTGTIQNNINADPLFVAPSSGSGNSFDGINADWSLQGSSLCINAGNPSGAYPALDIAGNPRIFNSIIDIGAYELQEYASIHNIVMPKEFTVYPNPFSDCTIIQFSEPMNNVTVLVANNLGQVVALYENINGQKFILGRNNLPGGFYFVRLEHEEQTIGIKKIVLTD